MKHLLITLILIILPFSISADDYPLTSIGVIDLNYILTNSKASIDASKQIEKIQMNVEEDLKLIEEDIISERERLIEQQSVMAPEAFEEKVKDFEKKVQNSQINRQESVRKLELMIQQARSTILDELKPILVEHSKEKGITVILEKNTVILSSDEMDITSAVMKKLDKQISKIDVKYND